MKIHFEMICPECLAKMSGWELCNDYEGELVITKKPISKRFPFVNKSEQMVERFTIAGTCEKCKTRVEALVCRTIENSTSRISLFYESKNGTKESRSFLEKERDLYKGLTRETERTE